MTYSEVRKYEDRWFKEPDALRSEYLEIIKKYPDAAGAIQNVGKVLDGVASFAGYPPDKVGNVKRCLDTSRAAEKDRVN
jgi:hypothetical protein